MESKRQRSLLLGVILVCFCMRSPISPIGPLVPEIRDALRLSAGLAGLLTAIPLLLFAVTASFAGAVMRRVDDRALTPVCLGLTLAGLLLRSYAGLAGLLCGTGLIGLGIGLLNVAIPVFLRANFPDRIGPVMGVYTMAMTLLSALSAGFCVPLAGQLGGWQNALAAFGVLPALALPVWLLATRRGVAEQPQTAGASLRETAGNGAHWCAGLCMGLQSILFFCLIAWLPSALRERGAAAVDTGALMLLMQLVSLGANLVTPILMQRFLHRRRLLAALCGAVYLAGLLTLLPARDAAARVTAVTLLGLGSGMSLSYALTLVATLGRTRRETAGLSAFAQGLGYLLAAPAPMLLGAVYDAAGSFLWPLVLLMAACPLMSLAGALAVPRGRAG